MGLFDGQSRSYSDGANLRAPSHHGGRTSQSHSRNHSPARSTRSGTHSFYARPSNARSSSSFFGGSTSRGIFSSGGSSSYYKRRPRDGYITYLVHKLQRMVKELWYYARRHPVKAFFAVIVPLLSAGGAIGGLLRGLGVSLPMMMGGSTRHSRGSGGYYGSSGYGRESSGGWMGQAGSLMQVARAFM